MGHIPVASVLVVARERNGSRVNVETLSSSSRFNALLVESDKSLGLEATLSSQGCSIHRVSSVSAASQDAVDSVDLVVISTAGFVEADVLDLVGRAVQGASVIVATDNTALAMKVAKLGASPAIGGLEHANLQITQVIALFDLKRKSLAAMPTAFNSNGVVQRRSTPLPKEATPDALDALIAAAEGLVPMHRFQRVYVDYALRRFGGNKVHTAAALGIDRRTIQRWARARSEQPITSTPPTTTIAS